MQRQIMNFSPVRPRQSPPHQTAGAPAGAGPRPSAWCTPPGTAMEGQQHRVAAEYRGGGQRQEGTQQCMPRCFGMRRERPPPANHLGAAQHLLHRLFLPLALLLGQLAQLGAHRPPLVPVLAVHCTPGRHIRRSGHVWCWKRGHGSSQRLLLVPALAACCQGLGRLQKDHMPATYCLAGAGAQLVSQGWLPLLPIPA